MHISHFHPHAQCMGGRPADRMAGFIAAVNRHSAGLVEQHKRVARKAAEARYSRVRDAHLDLLRQIEGELNVIKKYALLQRARASR